MDFNQSLMALSALGQETRLQVFRLLIRAGTQGMHAGEISDALNVRQNTMSANLSVLLRAGLILITTAWLAWGASLALLGLVLVLVDGWVGGSLVYKHGVGVLN